MMNPQFRDQIERRDDALVSPDFFDVAIGATSTTIYTGKADRYFLVRQAFVVNDTGGAINVAISTGGTSLVPTKSIPANTVYEAGGLIGLLLDVSTDITATGQNLRIKGWGIQILGGRDQWTL